MLRSMQTFNTAHLTADLRAAAQRLGFAAVGIARAEALPDVRRVFDGTPM